MTVNNNCGVIEKGQVKKAVIALQKYVAQEQKNNLSSAMNEEEPIQLQFSFKKAPKKSNISVKIKLPNSLVQETTDVCLIVKDLDSSNRDYQPTVNHFKKLLEKNGIKAVSQILPLKAIKLEYGPYEAKRNLSNMYDVFLADARIIRLLPGILGKSFYGRKKFPVQVNLSSFNIPKEFVKALHTTQCNLSGRGSSGLVKVSHCGLEVEKSVENIVAVAEKLFESLPGGAANLKNFYLKTPSSVSLPIYMNREDASEIELPDEVEEKQFQDDFEEVSTILGAKVRVTPSGFVEILEDGKDPSEYKTPSEKRKIQKEKKLLRKKNKKSNKASKVNVSTELVPAEDSEDEEEEPPATKRRRIADKTITDNKTSPKVKTVKAKTPKKAKKDNLRDKVSSKKVKASQKDKKSLKGKKMVNK